MNTLAFRLDAAGRGQAERRRDRLAALARSFYAARAARLNAFRAELRAKEERRAALAARLSPAMTALLARRRENLNHLEQMRFSLGHDAILQRGFALVRNEAGVVRSVGQAPPGTRLSLQFSDGRVSATAGERLDERAPPGKSASRKREAPPRKKPEGGQGSLF